MQIPVPGDVADLDRAHRGSDARDRAEEGVGGSRSAIGVQAASITVAGLAVTCAQIGAGRG
jgi:hypothetical protein